MLEGFGVWSGCASVGYQNPMPSTLSNRLKQLSKTQGGKIPFNSFESSAQSLISFAEGTGLRWRNGTVNGIRTAHAVYLPERNYGGVPTKRTILGVRLSKDGAAVSGCPVILKGNFPQPEGGYKSGYYGVSTTLVGNVFVEVVIDWGAEDYVSIYYNGTLVTKIRMSAKDSIHIGSVSTVTDINGSNIPPFLGAAVGNLLELNQWYYAVDLASSEELTDPLGPFNVMRVGAYGREEGDNNNATPDDIASQLPIFNSATAPNTIPTDSHITLGTTGVPTDIRFNEVGAAPSIIAVGVRSLGASATDGVSTGLSQTITIDGKVQVDKYPLVSLNTSSILGTNQNVMTFDMPKTSIPKGDIKVTYTTRRL